MKHQRLCLGRCLGFERSSSAYHCDTASLEGKVSSGLLRIAGVRFASKEMDKGEKGGEEGCPENRRRYQTCTLEAKERQLDVC